MKILQEKPELLDILFSFTPAAAIFITSKILDVIISVKFSLSVYLFIQFTLLLAVNILAMLILGPKVSFPVYWRSNLIANVMLVGILVATQSTYYSFKAYGIYLIALSFFHLSEYLITLIANYKTLNLRSFLLNHSLEYNLAAVVSWLEFFIEVYFFPSIKSYVLLWLVGLSMIVFGEVVRKLAMYTAGTNFNHLVQSKKSVDHVLVKHGVYSFSRHPSYLGWFFWSVGTQILLANPVCLIAYAFTSWSFFNSRIQSEEFYLTQFFGEEYIEYRNKVPIRIPFIKGVIFRQASVGHVKNPPLSRSSYE